MGHPYVTAGQPAHPNALRYTDVNEVSLEVKRDLSTPSRYSRGGGGLGRNNFITVAVPRGCGEGGRLWLWPSLLQCILPICPNPSSLGGDLRTNEHHVTIDEQHTGNTIAGEVDVTIEPHLAAKWVWKAHNM